MRITVVALMATSLLGCSSESADAPPAESGTNPTGRGLAGTNPEMGAVGMSTPGTTAPAGNSGGTETGAPVGTVMPSGTTEPMTPDLGLAQGSTGGNPSPTEGAGGSPKDESFDGMELFILFGQSNMAGSAPIEPLNREENPRVKVLGMYDCPEFGRVYNEWAIAAPPLHACFGELGPADYFAKALAQAWPDAEIGLVPNAVPGVEIDFFRKGMISREDQSYKQLPIDWDSAYDMMVARTRLAMESGRVRGILFHQGESDSGQQAWVGKVAEIVADLKADLGLGDVPFLPGELPPTACCGGHNALVNQLPAQIPNTVVISAQGLTVHDAYHFDTASVRIFGQRYADAFLALVPSP